MGENANELLPDVWGEGEKGGAPGLGGLWLRHMQRLRLRPALAGIVGV